VRVWNVPEGSQRLCLHGHDAKDGCLWCVSSRPALPPDPRRACNVESPSAPPPPPQLLPGAPASALSALTLARRGRRSHSVLPNRGGIAHRGCPAPGHRDVVHACAFGPDGAKLASGSRDGECKVRWRRLAVGVRAQWLARGAVPLTGEWLSAAERARWPAAGVGRALGRAAADHRHGLARMERGVWYGWRPSASGGTGARVFDGPT
jgi:hypothetical protein